MATFVTAASSNHLKSVKQLIRSIPNTFYNPTGIVFYDIGLTEQEASDLVLEFPHLVYRKLDFSKLPDFAHLSQPCAGAYAWKPYIIYEMYNELDSGLLIWCDAGNVIVDSNDLYSVIKKSGIYSPQSSYSVQELCHRDCREKMNVAQAYWTLPMRNAALVGVVCGDKIIKLFLSDWKEYSMKKEIIIPETSSRKDHRHDQSILTCLMYGWDVRCSYDLIGVKIHQDCD